EQLRTVNRAIEESAWGAYRTELYATYDYKSIWEASRAAKKRRPARRAVTTLRRAAARRLPAAQLVLQAWHSLGALDDEALVRPFARLLQLVAHRHPEAEPASIDLDQLDRDRHRHPHRGRRQARDVDARADRRLAGREARRHRLDGRLLDHPDHVRRREHADRL